MRKFSALLLLMTVLCAGGLPEVRAAEGNLPQEDAAKPVSERHIGSGHDEAGNPFYVMEVTWSDGSKTHEVRPGYFT